MLIKRTKCRLTGLSINASFWARLGGISLILEYKQRLRPLMKESEKICLFYFMVKECKQINNSFLHPQETFFFKLFLIFEFDMLMWSKTC